MFGLGNKVAFSRAVSYRYRSSLNSQILRMPYVGDRLSILVVLPPAEEAAAQNRAGTVCNRRSGRLLIAA